MGKTRFSDSVYRYISTDTPVTANMCLDLERKQKKEAKRLSKLAKYESKKANAESQAVSGRSLNKKMARLGISEKVVDVQTAPGCKKGTIFEIT